MEHAIPVALKIKWSKIPTKFNHFSCHFRVKSNSNTDLGEAWNIREHAPTSWQLRWTGGVWATGAGMHSRANSAWSHMFLPGTQLRKSISCLLGWSRFFFVPAFSSGFRARCGTERSEGAMAEEASASSSAAGKMTMLVGVDDSEPSWYALQWTLQHFFPPAGQPYLYRLVVVTAKPAAPCNVGLAGPGAADVVSFVEADLKRSSKRVIEKAKELCAQLQVTDAVFEVVEGDARNVLCEAVGKHHAELLVVGSHGYGAIKRAVLGSVSDYCIHHAHCTVMIVKKPKQKD